MFNRLFHLRLQYHGFVLECLLPFSIPYQNIQGLLLYDSEVLIRLEIFHIQVTIQHTAHFDQERSLTPFFERRFQNDFPPF